MKVIGLQASNFKRVRAVEMKLGEEGRLVIIRGRNGSGKSSVIDSVWGALKGLDFCPSKPIREGADKAEIKLDLGEYVVTRSFTEKGSYLTVKSADGAKISNPQALLNGFLGAFTFDPLEFARMKPPDQAKILAELSGIDLSSLIGQRKELYDQRTDANRLVKASRSLVTQLKESLSEYDPAIYGGERSTAEITEEIARRDKQQAKVGAALSKLQQTERDRDLIASRMQLLREELAVCQKGLDVLTTEVTALSQEHEGAECDLAAMPDVAAKMEEIENHNAISRRFADLDQAVLGMEANQKQTESLSAKIDELDERKRLMVEMSALPVDNLSFDEAGVSFKGIPFDQCSSSEQLKVSTAIGVATNPKLRVIRITDGSLLDAASMEVLRGIAVDQDFQIWVERVDDQKEGVGVLIEDGAIAGRSD